MIKLPKDLRLLVQARQAYYDYIMAMPFAPIWDDLSEAEQAFWIREVKSKMEYTIK